MLLDFEIMSAKHCTGWEIEAKISHFYRRSRWNVWVVLSSSA